MRALKRRVSPGHTINLVWHPKPAVIWPAPPTRFDRFVGEVSRRAEDGKLPIATALLPAWWLFVRSSKERTDQRKPVRRSPLVLLLWAAPLVAFLVWAAVRVFSGWVNQTPRSGLNYDQYDWTSYAIPSGPLSTGFATAVLVISVLILYRLKERLRELTVDRRLRKGQCGGRGYDIRATPARCPECGSAIAGAWPESGSFDVGCFRARQD